jgi:uncharacterized protein (TIRG00374 family)
MRRFGSLSLLISLGILTLLLSQLDLSASWQTLRKVDLRWFLPCLLFAVPEVLLKSLRLQAFVAKAGAHIGLRNATWSFLSGQPLASLTPGKLGDVTRIILLTRFSKLTLPSALAVHAADRIYDLAAVLLLAVLGLVSLLAGAEQHGPALAGLLGMLAGMVCMLLFLNPRWMRFLLKPLVYGLLSQPLAAKLSRHGGEFFSRVNGLLVPSFRVAGPFTLSFLAWETAILRAYFCAMALGLPLGFLKFALLAPVMIMIELLPISILGFGPREAAMFLLFASELLPKEDLLALSILIVLAGPLFVSLLGLPAVSQLIPSFRKPNEKFRS